MNKVKLLISKIYRFFYPIDLLTMYKKMGIEIGEGCKFQFGVTLDYSHYWHIKIGNNVTLAPNVHVLAHDASTKLHLGYTRIGKVSIEDGVFIGAGSIILPGVTIGKNSIVGAGSVVSKNIPSNVVVAGSPIKIIASLDDFLNKKKDELKKSPTFGEEYTLRGGVSTKMKAEMNQLMVNNIAYIN